MNPAVQTCERDVLLQAAVLGVGKQVKPLFCQWRLKVMNEWKVKGNKRPETDFQKRLAMSSHITSPTYRHTKNLKLLRKNSFTTSRCSLAMLKDLLILDFLIFKQHRQSSIPIKPLPLVHPNWSPKLLRKLIKTEWSRVLVPTPTKPWTSSTHSTMKNSRSS